MTFNHKEIIIRYFSKVEYLFARGVGGFTDVAAKEVKVHLKDKGDRSITLYLGNSCSCVFDIY